MSLKGIAQSTLDILTAGQFVAPSGRVVHIADAQQQAEANTKLYRPEEVKVLLEKGLSHSTTLHSDAHPPVIEVSDETTQIAAQRLVQQEGCNDLVLLNYASARNPGGGFLNGAKAQEEDLARCSGLYPCQLTQPEYYDVNRATQSLLYTDHLIYSPQVPWFRTRSRNMLEDYFLASVITAPAPNAGQVLRRQPDASPAIESALRSRAGYVLTVAQDNGHRTLLLGAWGCGVFRNDPAMVADAFGRWLESHRFLGCFDRVVFGIYDSTKTKGVLKAFCDRFP